MVNDFERKNRPRISGTDLYFGLSQHDAGKALDCQVESQSAEDGRSLGRRAGGEPILHLGEDPGGQAEGDAAHERQLQRLQAAGKTGCPGQNAESGGGKERQADAEFLFAILGISSLGSTAMGSSARRITHTARAMPSTTVRAMLRKNLFCFIA